MRKYGEDVMLKKGDRVTYSEAGITHLNPKNRNILGTVMNNPQHPMARYIAVRWDGARTAGSYHPSFIKREVEIAMDWKEIRNAVAENGKRCG